MDTAHPAQQHQLEELARQMARRGWIVRLELPAPVGPPQQGLVVRRRPADQAHLLTLVTRHLIQVWTEPGPLHRRLGTAADVDDVQDLLRQVTAGHQQFCAAGVTGAAGATGEAGSMPAVTSSSSSPAGPGRREPCPTSAHRPRRHHHDD